MQMQLGQGDDSTGVIRTEPVLVSRSTIVTMVEAGDWAVELPQPLVLHGGECVWVEGAVVRVRQPDGKVISYQGDGVWLCR
ncbi:hypothetical protein RB614_36370 [Phytohabitans sp. ZYX-F-186]|uniref:Uncharacterized protein n=1 Tax=Phytohabitans maris TaxID=3071409 RepID=A0ABU0ZSI2_9ACTN|nr:hypothetical protein [Phytohabitans sp. ZYX-F-186]MDQ7909988.1 hypothetical protein [Phytohabitans sp. ZYX-F-186]